jgi:DNA (cytosine-5)-methyltransferase 1
MNYLSVCSGIETATVAWHDLGWNPLGFSEIEKFPSKVLAHHYPNVPNLGDMTKYKEWNFGTNRLDLLVGGTPCQSFSVAGLRKGLDDPRGNLALTYVGILDKFRPKWCVWENVPGVLSSGDGRDFGSFLGALVECGYGFAYRVLDAKHFGVPQRRRRVFVVGCLGNWERAAKVLFEPESLRWDTKQSQSKRKKTTASIIPSIANCIQTTCNDYSRADGFNMIPEVIGTMTTRVESGTSEWFEGYIQPIALAENTIGRQPQNGGNGDGFTENGPMYTLNATGVHGIAVYEGHGQDCRYTELKKTLSTVSAAYGMGGGNIPLVQFVDVYNQAVDDQVSATMTSACGGTNTSGPKIMQNMAVRRLTPIECERLQGFPDNYTNIKEKCPDGPRYKALGNSMAVPVMRWIGERIANV